MSEQPTTPTPADIAPKAPEPAAAAPTAPPWGDDFDPEKAWTKIQALSKDLEKAKADKTPQAEKDANLITSLKKQLAEAAPKLAEYDKIAEASKSELQKAQEAAQSSSQRVQALLTRTVRAEVKALAADGFADPDDAATALDPSKYATPEGDVDTEAIKADLADLLTRKPHWAKASGQAPTLKPNPAQGRSASPPATAAEQIAAAQAAGDTRTVLRLKAALAMNPQT